MSNREIAHILYQIADFLEMEEVPFKPQAYHQAGKALDSLTEDLESIYQKGGLEALTQIPGVGESIAQKIEEYLKTGKVEYYQKLKQKTPVDIEQLTSIEGIGPKTVKKLYQKLGIQTVDDLEKAAQAGKIAPLFGFGKKTEQNILQGIAFLKKSKGRFLLGDIAPQARKIEHKLRDLDQVRRISIAGSLRRKKETVGDVDILVVTEDPEQVMDFFVNLPSVVKVWGKGPTKSSVKLKAGFDADLRVVPNQSFGSALQYFTGSKAHNIETRKIAQEKGLKLNEYGIFKDQEQVAGQNEKGVYRALNMKWIPPELRENKGEIQAALKGKLPRLIDYNEIKGDLHCHSKWDGGANSIQEIAKQALKMGYQYLGISDHTKFLKIEQGLDQKRLAEQRQEIEELNSDFKLHNSDFKILQGAETNILKDGSIDIEDSALEKLDYAIAGIHSHFKMEKAEMTERIIKAIKNPDINIISHPTGRLLKQRDEYQIDFGKILRAAKEFGVILEINSSPQRLDLNATKIKRAREAGVKMVINTDSHQKGQMRYIEYGIAQARRGWAEKEDIINTRPLKELLKFFE